MYLKRLELKGFKSFPTKTEIDFKEGITAIVGPNGSGKSNISDAVRWVLGEQSIKSLRGDKLEDVIFAGTDTKKPMNYCEVALTIDNTDNKLNLDFSEITIKRRVYRNGESEFFLNNKSCRLKDIKEILLDTGIGKDGYSIIEQGKVDEILSNNPVNRRKVFDEACGISKFRYKKQEAERNLKNTKENLERINDIYTEIEKQLLPLETQRKKAIKYRELSEELKVIEVNRYIKEIEGLQRELEEATRHSDLLDSQSKEIEKQKESIEKSHNETNSEIEHIDEGINKLQEYINTIKAVMSKKESDISLMTERIRNLTSDIERKNSDTKDISKKIDENTNQLKDLKEQKVKNESNVTLAKENIEKVENDTRLEKNKIESINQNIEKLKDEIISILNDKQQSNSKLSTLVANRENINSRKDNIDIDINEILTKIKYNNEILEDIKERIENETIKIENLKSNSLDTNGDLDKTINNKENLERNIQSNKYKLNEYKSKLNVYVDMENHYEGFNRGVKEVLKNKNLDGIYGALGQVIEVPLKYEKAVEASLGAYMQNIITKDEISAKFAINYLKKNNLGRVTFLPSNIIKSNKIDLRNIKTSVSYIGIASDLVSYDNKYKNIIENVLGRTIIIDNMDDAIRFAKDTSHKFKIVTLDGEILNPGGSLTGGSLKNNTNILSRKRLISEYKEKINTLNIDTDKLVNHMQNEINKATSLQNKINHMQNEISESDRIIIVEQSNLKRFEEETSSLKLNISKLEKEKNGLGDNLSYTLDKVKIVEDEIVKLDNRSIKNKEQIDILSKQLGEINLSYEKNKQIFDNLNLDVVKNNQIYQNIIKDIDRISNENNELENKKVSLSKSLENQVKEISKLQEEISIEKSEKINLDKQLSDNFIGLENKKVAKDGLKSNLEVLSKNLKSIDRQYIDLKESLFKVMGRLERIKASIEDYNLKLSEKYELTLSQAMEIKDNNVEIDKKYLENLKREIKKLGNVNIDSIKEYEEVKERHDFYSEQKLDLEQSIEAIEKLISELEKNMKIEFEENFNKINENFKYVYKRLFGGGYGELSIVDRNNILESDIEITAQPPGKKMKNLNLLSGGEKALTAISILFSILLAKPTPFCILDEIEAPLDDANIFRFGEFLKELSKDTQFIAVTHRRGTMEASDYIYGVTMQEKAISKVLSLKLNEAQEITDAI